MVYLDGEFVPLAEAKISVLDHGVLYGDGISRVSARMVAGYSSWRTI